jgi:hypothetical protein
VIPYLPWTRPPRPATNTRPPDCAFRRSRAAFRDAPEQANELAQTLMLCFLLRRFSSFFAVGYSSRSAGRRALARSVKSVFDQPPEYCSACPGIRIQISTDGFQPYISAITTTLSDRCDFAQLIKVYTQDPEGQRRYSPPDVTHAEKVPVMGNPDPAKICTSHVERQNLTIRMQMRRMTRLTNAFSKKWENLWAAYWLHFAYYNFCRIHQTLRVTPAMEAGITDRVWTISELMA